MDGLLFYGAVATLKAANDDVNGVVFDQFSRSSRETN